MWCDSPLVTGSTRRDLLNPSRELARDLLQSLKDRNRALLERERTRLRHQRDKELLRRKEAHESLLAMLNVSDWQDMLRLPTAEVM